MTHAHPHKMLSKTLLLIAGLCINTWACASASETKLVSQKVEQLRQAMIDGNGKVLKELSSPLLSYGHSGGYIEDQQAFIEKIASGKSDFVTMELADQT